MENKRIPQLCDDLLCTGCSACSNICPTDAIDMQPGYDGFLRPHIDPDRCIGCLACEKTCPVLISPQNSNVPIPTTYACWHKNLKIRDESSSGGAFTALAESIIEQGGYVVGAAFDDNMSVRHEICDDAAQIKRLRGSKYVQSEIGNVFRDVKSRLSTDKPILFVGTPCQISGLKSYLKKDYANLYCCDFICHGTPSPLLFKKYIEWIEREKHLKIHSFNFRHKHSGWYDALRAANGNCYMKGKYDAYFFGFNRNITLRESCYRCPSIGLPRKGDITIADYWGIGMKYAFNSNSEIHNGISLALINNPKGERLFEIAKKNLFWQQRHLDEALSRNQPMIKASSRPDSRGTFYNDMTDMPFEQIRNKYFTVSGKAKLIAWFRENAPRYFVTTTRKLSQYITFKRNGSQTL